MLSHENKSIYETFLADIPQLENDLEKKRLDLEALEEELTMKKMFVRWVEQQDYEGDYPTLVFHSEYGHNIRIVVQEVDEGLMFKKGSVFPEVLFSRYINKTTLSTFHKLAGYVEGELLTEDVFIEDTLDRAWTRFFKLLTNPSNYTIEDLETGELIWHIKLPYYERLKQVFVFK